MFLALPLACGVTVGKSFYLCASVSRVVTIVVFFAKYLEIYCRKILHESPINKYCFLVLLIFMQTDV